MRAASASGQTTCATEMRIAKMGVTRQTLLVGRTVVERRIAIGVLMTNALKHPTYVMDIGSIAKMGVMRPTQLVARTVVEWRIAFGALVTNALKHPTSVMEVVQIVRMVVMNPLTAAGRTALM